MSLYSDNTSSPGTGRFLMSHRNIFSFRNFNSHEYFKHSSLNSVQLFRRFTFLSKFSWILLQCLTFL